MALNTLGLLRAAREILADGYCRFTLANGNGDHCAIGALLAAAPVADRWNFITTAIDILDSCIDRDKMWAAVQSSPYATDDSTFPPRSRAAIETNIPQGRVAWYNNFTDQSTTLALFDTAIAKLEAQQYSEFRARLGKVLDAAAVEPARESACHG